MVKHDGEAGAQANLMCRLEEDGTSNLLAPMSLIIDEMDDNIQTLDNAKGVTEKALFTDSEPAKLEFEKYCATIPVQSKQRKDLDDNIEDDVDDETGKAMTYEQALQQELEGFQDLRGKALVKRAAYVSYITATIYSILMSTRTNEGRKLAVVEPPLHPEYYGLSHRCKPDRRVQLRRVLGMGGKDTLLRNSTGQQLIDSTHSG